MTWLSTAPSMLQQTHRRRAAPAFPSAARGMRFKMRHVGEPCNSFVTLYMPDPRSSHAVGIWNLVENLFRTLDTKKCGVLHGDDAKLFVDKLLKLKVMDLDAESISDLRALVDGQAGITIDSYSAVVLRGEQRQQHELRSKEDGHIVPGRFQQVVGFHDYSVQQQHPCYTTSSRDLGKKKPQVVDMPLRWHGAAGHFTKEFEMNVPGAKSVEVNQYRCRSLNVIQTKSKVHSSLDLPY